MKTLIAKTLGLVLAPALALALSGTAHAGLTSNGLNLSNGMKVHNGLKTINGLKVHNGLNSYNGLRTINGMKVHNGFGMNGLKVHNGLASGSRLWQAAGIDPAKPLAPTSARSSK